MSLARRPATDADRAFVERTMRRAYEPLVLRVHGTWDTEAIAAGFAAKWAAGGFEIVLDDGVPIGAIWAADEGAYRRLHEVFLDPAHHGRGIGARLVREEIETARRAGKRLRLRVLQENRARALYRRLGLVECETEGEKVWMETAGGTGGAGGAGRGAK